MSVPSGEDFGLRPGADITISAMAFELRGGNAMGPQNDSKASEIQSIKPDLESALVEYFTDLA
jgi:hypothetical protein